MTRNVYLDRRHGRGGQVAVASSHLGTIQRELTGNFTAQMDDEAIWIFTGYRVPRSLVRGPLMLIAVDAQNITEQC
jgi:hypothetical protein